jgi:hypothetical protein
MAESSQNYVDQLRQLNLSLRVQLEQAEARIPGINDLLQQLATIDLVTETALLGLVIFEGHYSVLTGPHDSGPLLQAALLIPGGLGVIHWDSEEYATFRKAPPQNETELFIKFVPFESCPSAIKALLLPQVEPLLELFFSRFRCLKRNSD